MKKKNGSKNETVTSKFAYDNHQWTEQNVLVKDLRSEARFQMRHAGGTADEKEKAEALRLETVEGFVQSFRSGREVPKAYVAIVDGVWFIVDGHTRYAGAKKARLSELTVLTAEMTEAEALMCAAAANAHNGRSRSGKDLLNAIKIASQDENFAALKTRDAAAVLGCSHTYISNFRNGKAGGGKKKEKGDFRFGSTTRTVTFEAAVAAVEADEGGGQGKLPEGFKEAVATEDGTLAITNAQKIEFLVLNGHDFGSFGCKYGALGVRADITVRIRPLDEEPDTEPTEMSKAEDAPEMTEEQAAELVGEEERGQHGAEVPTTEEQKG